MHIERPSIAVLAVPLGRGTDDPDLIRVHDEISNTRLREIMTRKVVTATPDEDIMSVLDRMMETGVKRTPVVDRGRMMGIVARRDKPKESTLIAQLCFSRK